MFTKQNDRLRVGSFNIKVGVDSSLAQLAADLYKLNLDLCAYQEIAQDWSLGTSIDQLSYLSSSQQHSNSIFFPLLKRDWNLDPYLGGPFKFSDCHYYPQDQQFKKLDAKELSPQYINNYLTSCESSKLKTDYANKAPEGYYGIGLSSKGLLSNHLLLTLPQQNDEQRGTMIANWFPKREACTVKHPSPLLVINTHLSIYTEERENQAQQLSLFLRDCKRPVLLLGDLNDEPSSKTVRLLCEEAGLFHLSPPELTEEYTFSVKAPHKRLDYILGKNVTCINFGIDTSIRSSDHFPIWADITW